MSNWKQIVEQATVRIDGSGGQGVLVSGGFILTATHCIKWNGEGGMTLGDYCIEPMVTKAGETLRVGPVSADPISDIAALGSLDGEEFGQDVAAFEEWVARTEAVPIQAALPGPSQSLSVEILSHDRGWIPGEISRYGPVRVPQGGRLCLEADDRINRGTSGGPVVDSDGALIGIVSNMSDDDKPRGMVPVAVLTLPWWLIASIGGKGGTISPTDLLIGQREVTADWQFGQAQKLLALALRTKSATALMYAAFEARGALDRCIFEAGAIIRDGKLSAEDLRKATARKGLDKFLSELLDDCRKYFQFCAEIGTLNGLPGEVCSVPNLSAFQRLKTGLSDYCHWLADPADTLEHPTHSWFNRGAELASRACDELRRSPRAFLVFDSLPQEVRKLWDAFLAGRVDIAQVRIQLREMDPILRKRLQERAT